MSRTVSKILAICAMVVVIPLMIVGTAFVAFYVTDRTINVSAYIDGAKAVNYVDEQGTEVVITDPQFGYGEKFYASHPITASQNKTIEVSAQASKAYKFEGWFAGSVKQYQEAGANAQLTKTLTLRINMEKAADEYVAVYKVVSYDVTWSYKVNPEVDHEETTEKPNVENAKDSYIYGEKLPEMTYEAQQEENPQYTYAGWIVKGGTSNPDGTTKRYKYATFDLNDSNSAIVLTNPWQSVAMATINFKDNTGATVLESKEVRAEEEFVLPDARETSKDADKAGYRYFWTSDQSGSQEITGAYVPQEGENTVYLQKEAIQYAVKAAEGDATFNNAEEITFTRENYESLTALFTENNWTLGSIFWEFNGIDWNGTRYATADAFVTAYVNANQTAAPETPGSVSANIVKNYTTFTGTAQFEYLAADQHSQTPDKNVKEGTISGDSNPQRPFDGNSTSLTLGELFGLEKTTSGAWYAVVNGTKHKVSLRQIMIQLDGSGLDPILDEETSNLENWQTMTLEELLNELYNDDVEEEGQLFKAMQDNAEAVEVLPLIKITGIYDILEETIGA